MGSPTRTRTWIDRLTAGCPAIGRSGNGGPPGYRPPRDDLARIICALVRSPCPVVVSIHTLLLFRQALSPDQLTGRIGAASRLRSDVFCLAGRNSAIELWPCGGQGTDSNLRTLKGTAFTAPLLWPLAYLPMLVAEGRIERPTSWV